MSEKARCSLISTNSDSVLRVVVDIRYQFQQARSHPATVAMVAVGFQFEIVGSRRINTANIALAMTFALVLLVAFDLDRAGEGLIHVNQQPMIDLYQSMSKHQ